jgi:hypothetical protein
MSETPPPPEPAQLGPSTFESPPPAQPRRSVNYTWRLLMLVPALALAGYGYYRHADVPAGGWVTGIRLTSKPDLAGQARDAYASVAPTTPDYYLVLHQRDGAQRKTEPFPDTPLGNGLTFDLAPPLALGELARVEVWDDNSLLRDKQLDRIELSGAQWTSSGQTYVIDLKGTAQTPPRWAMPLVAIGATLGAVVLLKFVWDQAL